MCGYRLYLLDDRDHITSAMDLECEDDAHAVRLAETSLNAPMELWQGARLVKRFDAIATRSAVIQPA
jgi:hypothetical protein